MEKDRDVPLISPAILRFAYFLAFLVVIAITARYFAFSLSEATKDDLSLGIVHGDVVLSVKDFSIARGSMMIDQMGVMARVLAVPGDKIEIRANHLWVNDRQVWEINPDRQISLQIIDENQVVMGLGDQTFLWPKKNLQSRAIMVLFSISPATRSLRWDRLFHTLN